eukprot:1188603-Prorocentrum_minimum.AAC.3
MTATDTIYVQSTKVHIDEAIPTFKGGRAGVMCATEGCGKIRTSLWRRGWPLKNGEYANLCNICGQKFSKIRNGTTRSKKCKLNGIGHAPRPRKRQRGVRSYLYIVQPMVLVPVTW